MNLKEDVFNDHQDETVRKILGSFKKFNPKLIPICGSINAVILLLELQWLQESFESNHGIDEFYHTDKQLRESLGLNRRQLENAKKSLVDKGLISYRIFGNKPPKTYYKVHVDKLVKYISQMYETYIAKCTKRTSPNVRFVHTKKNNKQDINNKTNNNKVVSVDNYRSPPNSSLTDPCGAVLEKGQLEIGNRTGLFLKLRDVKGISEKTALDIFSRYQDFQISNVLESARKKRGSFQCNEAAYILGALKKSANEMVMTHG